MTDLLKEKNSVITLNELKASVDETTIGGTPLNGIRHVELIAGISALADMAGLNPVIGDVVIQNGGPSKLPGISIIPYFADQYGNNDTRSMIIRRMYTSIMFKDWNETSRMGIAFTYTQDGICVAIGPNVSVCSNWSIYGAEQVVTTYMSNLKVAPSKILEVVGGWMNRYEEIKESTFQMEERMRQIPVFNNMAEQFFGRLQLIRVAHDKNIIRNGIYPMNQTQINQFAEDYLQWTTDNVGEPTLWDFYNIGTNLIKPKEMELGNMLPQSLRLGSSVIDFFGMN